mmetsp:Transcript_54699/g.151742  ORF Transcript_54699/g.151742 Transcript_54699/m.151742 type:complete len:532 (-) Transcript_54699:108-1703(-)
MLWADCCRVDRAKDAALRKRQLPKPRTPPGVTTRYVNVGIGSLAAGEVTLAEVLPPPSTRSTGHWSLFDALSSTGPLSPASASTATPPAMQPRAQGGDLLPFRRQKTTRETLQRRKSVACMEGYLDQGGSDPAEDDRTLQEATSGSIAVSDLVVRGPNWRWGDEDGGRGCVGTVLALDGRSQTIQVSWHTSGRTCSHYRGGNCMELELAPPGSATHGPRGAGKADGKQGTTAVASRMAPSLPRSNTKDLFADPSQTFIVLDWDDTLFPTTYVRDDLGLCWQTPLRNQRLDAKEKAEISRNLQRCSENCCALLRTAAGFGKVVLVTLAKSPWVSVSCDHFFPAVGVLISELGVPVVYAQEGPQVEYNKAEMESAEGVERHWSQVKGRAIAREISIFYSQYAGQSWKNIISIGDSDFERLGTMQATEGYMKQTGISRSKTVEVSGHIYKVRTKTFKMLDQPSVEELTIELAMVQKWLPLMIQLDSSFDVNLDDLEDPATLRRIERTLRGQKRSDGPMSSVVYPSPRVLGSSPR